LFISGNLLCQEMVGGVPSLKDNAVFGKFQYFWLTLSLGKAGVWICLPSLLQRVL